MNQKTIRICILENGRTPEDLIEEFGSYPEMIEKWLSPFLPEAKFTYISPVQGESLPASGDFDGYILTGSKYSTYERTPWMIALIAFLQQARQEHIPCSASALAIRSWQTHSVELTPNSPKAGELAPSAINTTRQSCQRLSPHSFSTRIRSGNSRPKPNA